MIEILRKYKKYLLSRGSWIYVECPWNTKKERPAQILEEPILNRKIKVHVLTNSNFYNTAQLVTLSNGKTIKVKHENVIFIDPKKILNTKPKLAITLKDINNIYIAANTEKKLRYSLKNKNG